ncbi:Sphingomyelin synthase-related protein 1 [Nymphon striatum]|nr:Sphingomyelin synthase-related protein 1 [Nymphon striatum]
MEDDVSNWGYEEVAKWLVSNDFGEYSCLLCDTHKIDGKALLLLNEEDLRQPPLNIKVLGDIKRLSLAIRKFQNSNHSSLQVLGVKRGSIEDSYVSQGHHKSGSTGSSENSFSSPINGNIYRYEDETDKPRKLEPEKRKALIAMIYFLTVTWLTAFVMVIVHDQVPDMRKYPPLPDIFLDNVPLIPWAFHVCEVTGLIMCTIWLSILLFHKHRFILLRRMFSLTGSVFLLRCVTMLITSLSVPGIHLKCEARPYGDMWAKLAKAYIIWKGGGLSLKGVRSCGDYMFSGHTVVLTLLNFFITEYTPINWYYLHTVTWVLNLFGIFFILAGHEHYSIDVFIAFYITTRLFLYYHSLANNRALMQRDSQRTRIWFPLFSYFESKVDYIVPNEYEWPFSISYNTKMKCKNKFSSILSEAKEKMKQK